MSIEKLMAYKYLNKNSPEIIYKRKDSKRINNNENFIIPVFKNDFDENYNIVSRDLSTLNEQLIGILQKIAKLYKFNGKELINQVIPFNNGIIVLIGCGNISNFGPYEYIKEKLTGNEKLRMLGIEISEIALKFDLESLNLIIRRLENHPNTELLFRILSEGIIRGLYNFDYKTDESNNVNILKLINIIGDYTYEDSINKGIKSGIIIGNNINFARALVDEPSNKLYPDTLAEIIKEYFKNSPCDIEIWDTEKIKKEKMGGLYAVSKGNEKSNAESKFIIIKDKRKSANGKIGLAGKGVTFDTGGYNIKKVDESILLMKKDMGGAGAIISAIKTIFDLNLDIEVVATIPATENTISSTAMKPGDIIKTYNGKTVEILHTDAEGRLILADALSYLVKNENPDYLIDAATLTGAMYVALGLKIGGFMGINPEQNKIFYEATQESGEFFWEMPLAKKYRENINGNISDLTNLHHNLSRYGGEIVAGLFLNEFIGNCKNWIHLDISAPSYAMAKTFLGDTALGFSISSIVRYIEKIIEKNNKK